MLNLVEDIVIVHFQHNGVFALVVVALGKKLLLDFTGSAAEAHLMELGHIVAQAHLDKSILVNEKLHQIHDALGRLIECESTGITLAHLLKNSAALNVLSGEEAEKQEGAKIKAGNSQCVDSGAAAGDTHHLNPLFNGGLYKLVAGVGNAGGAGISDDSHALAVLHLIDEKSGLAVLIELVV